ncbi:MAG: heme-binding protein [bacterium]
MKKWCGIVLCGLLCFSNVTMAAEERPHQVLKKDGAIEIRNYETITKAEVRVSGTRKDAATHAFRQLFRYISGGNETATKIAMTTPVAQVQQEDGSWRICFFMPKAMTATNTPAADNTQIEIITVPDVRMAAIRFSGRANQQLLDKKAAELKAYLSQQNYSFNDQAVYAFYNAPFVPGFLRRNEVLFELK